MAAHPCILLHIFIQPPAVIVYLRFFFLAEFPEFTGAFVAEFAGGAICHTSIRTFLYIWPVCKLLKCFSFFQILFFQMRHDSLN